MLLVEKSDRRGLVLALALMVAVSGWLLLRRHEVGPRQTTEPTRPISSEANVVEQVVASDAQRESRNSASLVVSERAAFGTGRVVDAQSGLPVLACIVCGQGPSVFSDAWTGRFVLAMQPTEPARLQVISSGYVSRDVAAELAFEKGGVEIELEPAGVATIEAVRSDDSPASGVRVSWRIVSSRPGQHDAADAFGSLAEAGRETERITDGAGRSHFATTGSARAAIEDPATGATLRVRVAPRETRRIELGRALRLAFVDFDTGEPERELEIESLRSGDAWAAAELGRTDAQGVLVVARTRGPVLLRLPGSRAFQRELLPLSGIGRRVGLGGDYVTMIELPAETEQAVIGVRRSGARLNLVDDVSGEPVSAPVRVNRWNPDCTRQGTRITACTWMSPRSSFGRARQVLRTEHGVLELPCTLYPPEGSSDDAAGSIDLALLVAGYWPVRVNVPAGRGPVGAASHVVRLRPALTRSVSVIDTDGRAFRRPVEIYSPAQDVVLWRSEGQADGLHGPFDWFGGPLRIVSHGIEIDEATLLASELVEVVVPAERGVIELVGAPEGAPLEELVAKLGLGPDGIEFRATTRLGDGCRFEGLPTGSYLVGPRRWVLGAEYGSFEPRAVLEPRPLSTRVSVRSGETTRISWMRGWHAEHRLSGRITPSGMDVSELLVLPIYGDFDAGSTTVPLARGMERLPLAADGSYCIESGSLLPRALAVVSVRADIWGSSKVELLEVLEPGASTEIRVATVQLSWTGPPHPQALDVRLETPLESYRLPLRSPAALRQFQWTTSLPLTILHVPESQRSLKVGRRSVPLELRAGVVTKITLESDAPADPTGR